MKQKLLPLCFSLFIVLTSCHKQDLINDNGPFLLSHESGFYDSSFTLTLSKTKNYDFHYTLDGSEPTLDSPTYIDGIEINNPSNIENKISNITNISSLDDVYFPNFNVDKCQIVKIKGFSKVDESVIEEERIFFVGLEDKYYSNLPIISLNMSYDDLFDYEKGIYVLGKTYDEGIKEGYKETYPANYNQKGKEWEREAEFSYFDENHSFRFSQKIGVRIHGGWSRAFNQKSFNLYARKEYGNKTFLEPFFDNTLNKTVMLRNGGYRDNIVTKLRDPLVHDMSVNEDFEVQRSKPVIVFLNGEYWGIYNLQERFADTYVEEHYSVDKDNVIIMESNELDEGIESDVDIYNEMIDFFKNHDLTNDDNYQIATSLIDINSFISYMSSELIAGNIDWPVNNLRMWRARENTNSNNKYENGKWRFMIYDTDDSASIISKCSYDSDPFINSSHWVGGPLDENCTIGLLFTKFIKNEKFKKQFKDEFYRIANNNFTSSLFDYLDRKEQLLKSPMVMFYKRFVSLNLDSIYFSNEVNNIKTFYEKRIPVVLSYLEKHII